MGRTKKQGTCALPARLVREEASALHARLLEHLAEVDAVELDAANVLEADGIGVQLLLSFLKSAKAKGTPVVFLSQSNALAAAIRSSGAEELCHQWTQQHGK